jgi:hypothetical protein
MKHKWQRERIGTAWVESLELHGWYLTYAPEHATDSVLAANTGNCGESVSIDRSDITLNDPDETKRIPTAVILAALERLDRQEAHQ